MREAQAIRVERAILHVLDHRGGEKKPVLSDIELDLGESPPVRTYFEAQVKNSIASGATAEARFRGGDAGAAKACYGILAQPSRLVPLSQDLARQLFAATASDGRISPGTLAVCLFRGAKPAGGPFLALLKIDLTTVPIVHRGKRSVSLQMAENALPSAREKLQKAALVTPPGFTTTYDLLLLDRQVEEVAAAFFASDFLDADWAATPQELTKHFYLGASKALESLTGADSRKPNAVHLEPDQAEIFRSAVESALAQNERIDTAQWVSPLRLPRAAKKVILAELDKKLGVREFPVDRATANRRTRKARFRGDYGVAFEVDSAYKEQVVAIRELPAAPDGATVSEVCLTVRNLKWLA
jgi:37-kD nucleoid-associated bacterial protein